MEERSLSLNVKKRKEGKREKNTNKTKSNKPKFKMGSKRRDSNSRFKYNTILPKHVGETGGCFWRKETSWDREEGE